MEAMTMTFRRGADLRRLTTPEPGLVREDRRTDGGEWDWRLQSYFGDAARMWGFVARRVEQLRERGWSIDAPADVVVRCMCCHRRKGADGLYGQEVVSDARRAEERLTVSDGICPACCLREYGFDPTKEDQDV